MTCGRCRATRDPDTYQMPGETEDTAITISGGQAVESLSTLRYDEDAATITDIADPENPIVSARWRERFVADDGTVLRPGFTLAGRVQQLP